MGNFELCETGSMKKVVHCKENKSITANKCRKMLYIEKFKNEQHPFFQFWYSLQFAWTEC
jgi:hypothetical protein